MKYYIRLVESTTAYNKVVEEYEIEEVYRTHRPDFYFEDGMEFDSREMAEKFCILMNRIKRLEDKFRG